MNNVSMQEDVFSSVLILSSAKATKEFMWRRPRGFSDTFTYFTYENLRVDTKRATSQLLASCQRACQVYFSFYKEARLTTAKCERCL